MNALNKHSKAVADKQIMADVATVRGYKLKPVDWRQKKLKPAMLERNPGRELWQPAYNAFNIRITRRDEGDAYEVHAAGVPTTKFMNIADAMLDAETTHNLKLHHFLDQLVEFDA